MTKILLSIVFIGFALAAQAGDDKACSGANKSCTMKTSTGTCTMKTSTSNDSGCCHMMTKNTTSTCHGAAMKVTLMSPKGAEQQAPKLMASR